MSGDSGSATALVVVDVLNPYQHDDADQLAQNMADTVDQIALLLDRARDEQRPIIYVNDNYGHWNSSATQLLEIALKEGRHPELVEPLRPPQDANFVIKARHSIFYQTPLEHLLRQLDVSRLLLCGQVTEQCILNIAIPTDAVAHIDPQLADAALQMMRRNMRAQVKPTADYTS